MAPKKNAAATTPMPSKIPQTNITSSQPARKTSKTSSSDAQDIVFGVWNKYVDQTPQRVKLLDTFMAFLIMVGVLQFVYCVIAGNYVRTMDASCGQMIWDTMNKS